MFEEKLKILLGDREWDKFRKVSPSAYIDLMDKFELRKREATVDRKKAYNLALSFAFIQFFSSTNIERQFKRNDCPKGLRYNSKLGIIRIEADLMVQMFDSVVEPIRRHVKRELNVILEKRQVPYAFLVGGFAQSAILCRRMKESLEPETILIVPSTPHLAVMHGAALFGLDPTLVRLRRAMHSYGVGVLARFDPTVHPSSAKTFTQNGEKWCCDVFDRYVTINQPVGLFQRATRRYKPVIENQSFCLLHIYTTDKESITLVSESGVRKCGTVYLELEPYHSPGKRLQVNPAIKDCRMREVETEMFFGTSQIQVI